MGCGRWRAIGPSPSLTWQPTAAGTCYVAVWARNAGVATDRSGTRTGPLYHQRREFDTALDHEFHEQRGESAGRWMRRSSSQPPLMAARGPISSNGGSRTGRHGRSRRTGSARRDTELATDGRRDLWWRSGLVAQVSPTTRARRWIRSRLHHASNASAAHHESVQQCAEPPRFQVAPSRSPREPSVAGTPSVQVVGARWQPVDSRARLGHRTDTELAAYSVGDLRRCCMGITPE